MDQMKCIAFLDVLGFSNYVVGNESGVYAANLLYNVSHMLSTRIVDQTSHPPDSYEEILRPLALRTAVTSFENYLPLSDSVFITSSDANTFIAQLSTFLSECFLLQAKEYLHPVDPTHPEVVLERDCDRTTGEVIDVKSKWYPILFRGGISYGEVLNDNAISIVNGERRTTPNLIGKGVVNAVRLGEDGGKGPKLFIDDAFYNQLNEDHQSLVLKDVDGKKHFLWPAYHYVFENSPDMLWGDFIDFAQASINLWKAYCMETFSVQYAEFLKLSILSFTKLCEIKYPDRYNDILKKVRRFLNEQNVDLSFVLPDINIV